MSRFYKCEKNLRRDSSFTGPTDVKSLRDRVCSLLRQKTEKHQKIRDHQRLATIEERGLAREGLSADEARDRAWQIAAAVMENTKWNLVPNRLTHLCECSSSNPETRSNEADDRRRPKWEVSTRTRTAGCCPICIGRADPVFSRMPVAFPLCTVGK